VLLLAVSVLPRAIADPVDAGELYRVVTAYYYAIGENRLAEAMSFYHEDSPQTDNTRQELAYGQSAYLQRTSTLSFDVVYDDGEQAVAIATHRHLRITGVKFMEQFVVTRYVLRRQGDGRKIWSIGDRPLGHQGNGSRHGGRHGSASQQRTAWQLSTAQSRPTPNPVKPLMTRSE